MSYAFKKFARMSLYFIICAIACTIDARQVSTDDGKTIKKEITFTLPDTAQLDSISVQYHIKKGSLENICVDLKKIIKGGDLPDPRILDVGNKHTFDVALGEPQPPFQLSCGSNAATTIPVLNPVYDVLQPCQEIKYEFTIRFVPSSHSTVVDIACIKPNYTLLSFPTPPPSAPQPTLRKRSEQPPVHKVSNNTNDTTTTTPIKHVILIMLENISFDNIFGTYPLAVNDTPPFFYPVAGTPIPDNLLTIDPLTGGNYLTTNRNVGQNGTGRVNPQRLARNQVLTNFEANGYTRMQLDVHNGLCDHYVLNQKTPPLIPVTFDSIPTFNFDATYGYGADIVMNYWDGNTFNVFWQYAQNYAMSDRCFCTGYGESTVAAINWGSGNNSKLVPEYPDLLIPVSFLNIIANTLSTSGRQIQIPPGAEFIKWKCVLEQINNVALYDWIFPKSDISILFLTSFWYLVLTQAERDLVTFPDGLTPVQFFQRFTANFICPEHKNIGDLLNNKNITWGSFLAGFLPPAACGIGAPFPPCSQPNQQVIPYNILFAAFPGVYAELVAIMPELANGTLTGVSVHESTVTTPPSGILVPLPIAAIIGPVPDFEDEMPFSFYASTSNPHLNPPTLPITQIGNTDQANHNYDLSLFFESLTAGSLPAVSYVRLPSYQSGHPDDSNAIDCQNGVLQVVNAVMSSEFWNDTVIFIQTDEGNGNYDHVPPPLIKSSSWNVNPQIDPADEIARRGAKAGIKKAQLRAGYGPRIPFLVISPFAKPNYISHTVTDQTSVIKFIEDNWQLGRLGHGSYDACAGSVLDMFDFSPERTPAPKVFIDPKTHKVTLEQS